MTAQPMSTAPSSPKPKSRNFTSSDAITFPVKLPMREKGRPEERYTDEECTDLFAALFPNGCFMHVLGKIFQVILPNGCFSGVATAGESGRNSKVVCIGTRLVPMRWSEDKRNNPTVQCLGRT